MCLEKIELKLFLSNLRIIPFIIFFGCFCGCDNSEKGLKNLGREVFKDLNNYDTARIRKKFYNPSVDTNIVKSYTRYVSIDSGEIQTNLDKRKNSKLLVGDDDIIEILYGLNHLKANYHNSNLWEKELKYLTTKVDTVEKDLMGESRKEIEIKVYFSYSGTAYKFEINDLIKLENGWKFCSILNPVSELDLLKANIDAWRRANLNTGPMVKSSLRVKRYSWRREGERFKKFFVMISNQTERDFDKVKFRLKIFDESGYSREKILSNIYTANGIKKGDVVRNEIRDLRGFYPGFNIQNKDEWSIETVIKELAPPPVDTPEFNIDQP